MFKKILVPIDDSEFSQEAVQFSLEFAKKLQSQVVFAFAQIAFVSEEEGLVFLAPARDLAREHHVVSHSHTIDGTTQSIGTAIANESQDSDCEIIIMATHGREGISRVLLGSVAEEVSRLAKVPVMLLRSGAAKANVFGHILVAIDGSSLSLEAMKTANDLAIALGSSLEVINIIPNISSLYGYMNLELTPPIDYARYEQDLERSSQAIIEAALKFLETSQNNLKGIQTLSVHANQYSLGEAILATATEHKADLIVLGTHGYAGLERLLLGSVAEQVSHHAKVPVLLVRSQPQLGISK